MTNLIERLGEMLTSTGVKRAYGDPVDVGGKEIVPVALVQFGFGGGEGPAGEGEGAGGGGGGMVIPVGAYVPGPDGPRFEPNPVAMLAVSIPALIAAGCALAVVVRALNR